MAKGMGLFMGAICTLMAFALVNGRGTYSFGVIAETRRIIDALVPKITSAANIHATSNRYDVSTGCSAGSRLSATATLIRTPVARTLGVEEFYIPQLLSVLLRKAPAGLNATQRTNISDMLIGLYADDGTSQHSPGAQLGTPFSASQGMANGSLGLLEPDGLYKWVRINLNTSASLWPPLNSSTLYWISLTPAATMAALPSGVLWGGVYDPSGSIFPDVAVDGDSDLFTGRELRGGVCNDPDSVAQLLATSYWATNSTYTTWAPSALRFGVQLLGDSTEPSTTRSMSPSRSVSASGLPSATLTVTRTTAATQTKRSRVSSTSRSTSQSISRSPKRSSPAAPSASRTRSVVMSASTTKTRSVQSASRTRSTAMGGSATKTRTVTPPPRGRGVHADTADSDVPLSNKSMCFAKGTRLTLSDGSTLPIEDVTMATVLASWDFDEARMASSTPLWIKVQEHSSTHNHLQFSDGTVLETVGYHRILNVGAGAFTPTMSTETPLGTITRTYSGAMVTLVSAEAVVEPVDYYNVISGGGYMNVFANGILTSCRFSNLYPIVSSGTVYNKDAGTRFVLPPETRGDKGAASYAREGVPRTFFEGLRLGEQLLMGHKEVGEYVGKLLDTST